MKPSFHVRPFNGPFDDPGLYIRVLREGRAVIFDLGFTTALSPRDILKVTDIFVSHTHIDHFIGFDNILRVSLNKESPLKLYGPEGFIDCVEGKLRSYTWNLIGDYPLIIEVEEINNESIKKAVFKAENSFDREDLPAGPFASVLLRDPLCTVSTAILDHQVPCLAFSLEEDCHINIDKARLSGLCLPVGPWLKQLKTAIRENKRDDIFTINGRTFSFRELDGIANITRGQKLSYVVDAVGSEENISKIVELVKGSDVLYIEMYFLDEDMDKARERYHLTAKEAGRIAREAGVGRLEVMHMSPRYMDFF
ncbi:MAG: ribonuclease Z [Nitrospirae bacterium]|nr:ribonuclease Z [Nitrospirota bacterium]